jgi:magnesium transporter
MHGQTIIPTHDIDELFISTIVRLIQRRAFLTLIPMFFKRIRIDPAIATGPFVTTAIDVVGIFTYFLLAKALLF